MDINSLFGFDRGANREAADYARQNDGRIELNPIQRLFGADEQDVQNILDTEQRKALNQELGGAAALAGRSGALNGETRTQMQGRIAAGQRQMKAAEEAKQRGYRKQDAATALTQATTLKGMDLQAGRDQFNSQLSSQNARHAFDSSETSKRYAFERKENQLMRQQERELSDSRSDLQMQMALMNEGLQEKQMEYDRETRSMDKRDRMIAQLLSGLGSLGGAFSL